MGYCGTPQAIKWSLELIEKLENICELKLKWNKMSVHSPSTASAKNCRRLLPSTLQIIDDEEMNFVYLKTPVVSDKFVEVFRRETSSVTEGGKLVKRDDTPT